MSLSSYDAIGGDAGVRRLVDRFYDHMDTLPAAAGIRALHPSLQPPLGDTADTAGAAPSREKLYWFLSGWLGGPQLFVERKGHPRLRARHLPFAIGPSERDQWMACMSLALEEVVADPQLRASFHRSFDDLATHMINRS